MINRFKTKEFHFVLNDTIKDKIKNISNLLNLSISKTIVFIIENTNAILNKIHF
jgi:hypothetical protein